MTENKTWKHNMRIDEVNRKKQKKNPLLVPHFLKEVVCWQDFKQAIFPATKQMHFVPLSKHVAMAQAQAVSSDSNERLL